MVVAEKLGMTLTQLRENMTVEELRLWSIFFDTRQEEERKAMDKTRRGRR